MIIYLCTKFQSNTRILSKDIARKPFFKTDIFSKLKRAISPKIIGGFYPNLTYIYYYIPVCKISIQYTNPFKRSRTETKSVMDGTGRMYVRTAVILYAPIENGGGWGGGGGGIKHLNIFRPKRYTIGKCTMF